MNIIDSQPAPDEALKAILALELKRARQKARPVNSRTKGAAAEREFCALVATHLGVSCQRNLEQSRSGGHDITGLDGWAPEIKARAEQPPRGALLNMWAQTLDQANAAKARPVLAVKVNRKGWTFYIDAAELRPDIWQPCKSWVAIEPEDFFQYARGIM